ncbi:uncharacterized protein LOC143613304 [Bidens hawaiensis]|uniref:uncharacterized protein LOC143613304 n=1 Tax=Bidens hawaiensis TaxID=980011 RepID=UPI00404A81DB
MANVGSPLANVGSPMANVGSPLANVDSLVDNLFRAKPNRNSNSNKFFTKNISMDLQDSPVIKPDREANKRFRSPRKVVESESSESEDDSPIKVSLNRMGRKKA